MMFRGLVRTYPTHWARRITVSWPLAAATFAPCNIYTNVRLYHRTERRDLVPVVVVGCVLVLGVRYSIRALRRMEDEWDDYQWQLAKYEAKSASHKAARFPDGTVGIDVGSMYVKTAHDADIVATPDGSRYPFAGIAYSDGENFQTGELALDKFFELRHSANPQRAILPNQLDRSGKPVFGQIVLDSLKGVLRQKQLDNYRTVLTVPVKDPAVVDSELLDSLTNPSLVPEPVAALWGAQHYGLLNETGDEGSSMVVDVGASRTAMSVVRRNVVLEAVSIDFGGEMYVKQMVLNVFQQHPQLENDEKAMQLLWRAAQSSNQEQVAKPQVRFRAPFVGMDLQTKQPLHIDMTFSATILEKQVEQTLIKAELNGDHLSEALPAPTCLKSLLLSIATKLLTNADVGPHQLSDILLVGGASHHVQSSLKGALELLQGNFDNLVIPTGQSPADLVAVGASAMMQQYRYDGELGLVREGR